MRIGTWLMPAVVVLGALVSAQAQVDTAQAQKKLLSKRAAEADAYRKLAEVIKGLQITSNTYVRDFVAENDDIRAEMDEFIKGVRLGQPRWLDDLSCEVPGEVTVQKVVEELKACHSKHYKGDQLKARDFEQIIRHVERNIIKVVGQGAPREDLPPDLPEGVVEKLGGPPVPPEPPLPPLWVQIGSQGRLMAELAAATDAKRQLLERIKGLRIASDTTVRDFVAESDQITAQAMGHIIGVTKVRTYLHSDEPIAEVTVEVPVETVVEVVKELHSRTVQGDSIKGLDTSNITKCIKTKTFQATGMGIPFSPRRPEILRSFNSKMPASQQVPPWAALPLEMTGQGVPPQEKAGTPQGKLVAARAAEMDGKRRLAEYVQGLQISSSTVVKDFVTQHDDIRAQMNAVLVGATVVKTVFKEDGTAEVTVSLPGMKVWGVLNDAMRTTAAAQ